MEAIWSAVADSADSEAPLAFSDIGIILAGRDADAYRAHFAAVFEEYHQVPHHFVDVPVASKSRVVEAVELIVALPTSRFTRQDLLRLLTHPTVMPVGDDATADEWAGWCHDLAIVHGADHDDHAQTYIEADLLNWDQGLTRLTLGLFMADEDPSGPVLYKSDAFAYLPHAVAFDRAESAAQLVTLARSLIADARYFAQTQLSLKKWMALLRIAFTAYIVPRDDGDERDLLRVLAILERFESDDVTGADIPFGIVQALITEALGDLTENIGQPLADGVVVCPLRLCAALPLRLIFMPGLHEGAFPMPDPQSGLDVRRHDRRPGEIGPRERDQYQFLARLLATEDRVCLSYVARDAATGDRRAPAPTLVELLRILEPYVGDDPQSRLVRRPTLRRYTEAPHPYASISAQREAETRRWHEQLRTVLPPPIDEPTLKDHFGAEAWRRISAQLSLRRPSEERADLPDTVTLRTLRMFLEDPLQGWVYHALGLRSDDGTEDVISVVDERFRADALATHNLLRTVILETVRTTTKIDDVYAAHADRLEIAGVLPTGVFKQADRRRHLRILQGWQRALRKVFANRPQPFDPIRFGRGADMGPAARSRPGLRIDLDAGPVELRGSTQPAIETPPASVVLKTGSRPSGGPPAHELPAFIDQVARSAAGEAAGSPYVVWTVYGDGQAVRTRFDAFAQAEAQSYLVGLIHELRSETHDYLLPFSAIDRAHRRQDGSEEGWAPILASVAPARFGPLAGFKTDAASPDRAQDILRRRFGPFYQRRREELGR